MSNLYCTRGDVYTFGLPRGLIANPARLCASALASTDRFELDDHGFSDGDELLFRAESSGSLPAPIVAGTTYYAKRVNDSFFQASLTVGGAAIDLTASGTSVLVATPLPFAAVIESWSRFVDDHCPAHLVPFTAGSIPIRVVRIVAKLSAFELHALAQQKSVTMADQKQDALGELKEWKAGLPLRDSTATGGANLSVSESLELDPRGWGNGGTLP